MEFRVRYGKLFKIMIRHRGSEGKQRSEQPARFVMEGTPGAAKAAQTSCTPKLFSRMKAESSLESFC
jgi:hypothetical protein